MIDQSFLIYYNKVQNNLMSMQFQDYYCPIHKLFFSFKELDH